MNLESLVACPLCGQSTIQNFLTCKDYTVTGELFHVKQCAHCQFTFTNPRPQEESAGAYYQSSTYISHSSQSQGFIDRIYLIIRGFTVRWKYNLIAKTAETTNILDIGCGTGHFAAYAKSKGANVFGVEPSDQARVIADTQGVKTFSSIDQITAKKFNAITMWHVLEHIYDLDAILKKIRDRLSDDGTIFIAVPNYESDDATRYKEYWAAFDVPRHVWHFSRKSMEKVLKRNHLKIVRIIPMKMDSYYVSILSEKYANNGVSTITGFTKGLFSGLMSNLKARKTTNHSSLIYIVKNEAA